MVAFYALQPQGGKRVVRARAQQVHPNMTDLVIIYNHKYESNVPKLDHYYRGRFRKVWHLMPFYRGSAENVIPVYDGSFTFHGFVAQAAAKLKQTDAERFLFLSDDLLLDPGVNQQNILERFGIQRDWGFMAELHDLSEGIYARGVFEARKATLQHPGLEIKNELPPPEEALKRIGRHIKLKSMVLCRFRPYLRKPRRPLLKNAWENWKIFKGNIWHLRECARHRLRPKRLEYPLVGGYSDLFIVPGSAFEEFVHYCGVLAAARIFVEIALPTAMAFTCERIGTEDSSPRRGFNVWFPISTYEEMERKSAMLKEMENKAQYSLSNLMADWPKEYLYVHPVKLSKWKA